MASPRYEIKRVEYPREGGNRASKLARAEKLLADANDWNPGVEYMIWDRVERRRIDPISVMDRLLASDREG